MKKLFLVFMTCSLFLSLSINPLFALEIKENFNDRIENRKENILDKLEETPSEKIIIFLVREKIKEKDFIEKKEGLEKIKFLNKDPQIKKSIEDKINKLEKNLRHSEEIKKLLEEELKKRKEENWKERVEEEIFILQNKEEELNQINKNEQQRKVEFLEKIIQELEKEKNDLPEDENRGSQEENLQKQIDDLLMSIEEINMEMENQENLIELEENEIMKDENYNEENSENKNSESEESSLNSGFTHPTVLSAIVSAIAVIATTIITVVLKRK